MQYRLMGVKHLSSSASIFQSRKKTATEPDPYSTVVLIFSLYKCQSLPPPHLSALPELKHPSYSTMGGALVRMSFLPDASVGWYTQREAFSHFFSMSQLPSRKTSNSQNEVVCHQMHTSQRCKMMLPVWSHT